VLRLPQNAFDMRPLHIFQGLAALGLVGLELEREIRRADLRAASTTMARSTAFSSSRTLPGQSWRISVSSASAEICGIGRLVAMQNLLRK